MVGEEILSVCPYCGSQDVEEIDGRLVCLSCGSVLDENVISTAYDRRFFSPDEFYERATAPAPRKHWDIDMRFVRVRAVDEPRRRAVPLTPKDRVLKALIDNIRELASALGATDLVLDEAYQLAKKFIARKNGRMRSVRLVAAAILYIAFRNAGMPKQLATISRAIDEEHPKKVRKELRKALKQVAGVLGLKVVTTLHDVSAYVHYFAKELKLSSICLNLALRMADRVKTLTNLGGRDPASVAAAIILLATKMTGEGRPASKIARLAAITENTVKVRSRELMNLLGFGKTVGF